MKIKISVFSILAVVVMLAAGCSKTSESVPGTTQETTQAVTSETKTESLEKDIQTPEPAMPEESSEKPENPDTNVTGQVKTDVLEYRFVKGEGDLAALFGIDKYTGSEEWYFFDVDMDKDGSAEKFILVDIEGSIYGDGITGDLWFCGKDFDTQVDADKNDAYPQEYCLTAYGYDYGNEIKVIQNFFPAMVNSDGYILQYKDNMIEYPFVPKGSKSFCSNGMVDIFVESYSMCSDGTGHCWVPHRYKFSEDEWIPAEYKEISEEEATEISGYDIKEMVESSEDDITSVKIDKVRLEEDERIIASVEYKYEGFSDVENYETVYITKVYYSGFTSGAEWQFSSAPGQYDFE